MGQAQIGLRWRCNRSKAKNSLLDFRQSKVLLVNGPESVPNSTFSIQKNELE
jgi:hypothetical protein